MSDTTDPNAGLVRIGVELERRLRRLHKYSNPQGLPQSHEVHTALAGTMLTIRCFLLDIASFREKPQRDPYIEGYAQAIQDTLHAIHGDPEKVENTLQKLNLIPPEPKP